MKLEIPALSPTIDEGTIVQWNIPEGGKVNVGDVICDIQTDKATVGFESQEEGYIAKILSPDGAKMVCGGLIGIMVEEKEDIASLDMESILKSSASAAEKTAQPEPKKPASKAPEPQVAAAIGTDAFLDELDHMLHGGSIKVSPAAGWWMRAYMVLPSEVKPTGPKGFILKSDVMEHIESNNLVLG